ncbi:hypothetical protein KAI65_00970 [Candidatus Parcubacteria bacterium]|nr:hypothetical protein [Candidatus Parcubacteria bacterium]
MLNKKIIILVLCLFAAAVVLVDTANAGNLAAGLRGKILLQVESNGEAWYIEPAAGQRIYLGRPADAFQIMRELGVGISEYDYGSFKVRAPQRLLGCILLRVEANGEAYYVHPENLKLIYLGRPADAFEIMRKHGLGITNNDLNSIPVNEKYAVSDEIKKKILDFINGTLMQAGTTATIKNVALEGDMYKIILVMSSGQEVTSYTDKAVTKFFPQAMDINKPIAKPTPSAPSVDFEDLQKTDKPDMELFVMSHCPYGTQIEKAILPVVKLLDGLIDFEIKFVDYAMHGKIEVDEQLRQYCIQENNMTEYLAYLECFLEDGDNERCLDEIGAESVELNNCINRIDQEFGIYASYEDKSTWISGRFPIFNIHQSEIEQYGIKGSPTVIVNGQRVNTQRSPDALLNAICAAFIVEPSECSIELSDKSASPGFGYTVNQVNNNASGCGI